MGSERWWWWWLGGGTHAVCVEKKNAARQHYMAKDKEWKPMNKMGDSVEGDGEAAS